MSSVPHNPQCIFCKCTSTFFSSVEHIVPESLGNTEHFLPKGVVCDACNNYFSRKVEGPVLNSEFFVQIRHRNGILSKRGRVPVQKALLSPSAIPIEFGVAQDGSRYICTIDESLESAFLDQLKSSQTLSAYFIVPQPPDHRLFARFLLLMGLKALASRMLVIDGGLQTDHINNLALDEARDFVRYGKGPPEWPFHDSFLYPEGKHFTDTDGQVHFDIPHEYTLLYTPRQEMYFVIALFGMQYTINLGGPELDGFHHWLAAHANESPLYPATA